LSRNRPLSLLFPICSDKWTEEPILDTALEIVGIVFETAFLWLLLHRRAWRSLPVFCLYLVWGLAGDLGTLFLRFHFPAHFLEIYIGELALDSAFQYAVLVELTWSVLRPHRAVLPRGTVAGIAVLFLALGGAAWPFSDSPSFAHYPSAWHLLAHLQQDIAVVRVVFFLALAGCCQLLMLGWRDRELQVATGLGFYSLLSLAGSVMHTHHALKPLYHAVDQTVAASYAASLLYWIFSYAQAEVPRREFTPQMQGLVVALAGAARAQNSRLMTAGRPGSGRIRQI
jgi:hypothetical protein